MSPTLHASLLVLAASGGPTVDPTDPSDSGDTGTAGPLGLLLTVLLLIAVVFLVRSMGKHLRRVPRSFDPPTADEIDLPPVPDTPAELLAQRAPGEDLLDRLRRAPRAIEPPRPVRPDRPGA